MTEPTTAEEARQWLIEMLRAGLETTGDSTLWFDEEKSRLIADMLEREARVRVKPLVWVESRLHGAPMYYAEPLPHLRYEIRFYPASDARGDFDCWACDEYDDSDYPTLAAAQEGVWKKHEAAILSSIEGEE